MSWNIQYLETQFAEAHELVLCSVLYAIKWIKTW